MAGFLYYLPNYTAPLGRPENLPSRFGLSSVFLNCFHRPGEYAGMEHVIVERGPDGGRGAIVCVSGSRESSRIGYYRERQVWTEIPNDEGDGISHWVGWDKDAKPKPEDLERPFQVGGWPIQLGDGNRWVIPAVHAQASTLPRAARLVKGTMQFVHLDGYEAIVSETDQILSRIAGIAEGTVRAQDLLADCVSYAAHVLAVNYRVRLAECLSGIDVIMGEEETYTTIINAATGMYQLQAAEAAAKKNEPLQNTDDTSLGEPEDSQTTDQPTPTSIG